MKKTITLFRHLYVLYFKLWPTRHKGDGKIPDDIKMAYVEDWKFACSLLRLVSFIDGSRLLIERPDWFAIASPLNGLHFFTTSRAPLLAFILAVLFVQISCNCCGTLLYVHVWTCEFSSFFSSLWLSPIYHTSSNDPNSIAREIFVDISYKKLQQPRGLKRSNFQNLPGTPSLSALYCGSLIITTHMIHSIHSRLVNCIQKNDELTKNAVITTLGAQASYRRAILGSDSYCYSKSSRAGTLPHSLQSFLEMSWNLGHEFRESRFCPFPEGWLGMGSRRWKRQ